MNVPGARARTLLLQLSADGLLLVLVGALPPVGQDELHAPPPLGPARRGPVIATALRDRRAGAGGAVVGGRGPEGRRRAAVPGVRRDAEETDQGALGAVARGDDLLLRLSDGRD